MLPVTPSAFDAHSCRMARGCLGMPPGSGTEGSVRAYIACIHCLLLKLSLLFRWGLGLLPQLRGKSTRSNCHCNESQNWLRPVTSPDTESSWQSKWSLQHGRGAKSWSPLGEHKSGSGDKWSPEVLTRHHPSFLSFRQALIRAHLPGIPLHSLLQNTWELSESKGTYRLTGLSPVGCGAFVPNFLLLPQCVLKWPPPPLTMYSITHKDSQMVLKGVLIPPSPKGHIRNGGEEQVQ